ATTYRQTLLNLRTQIADYENDISRQKKTIELLSEILNVEEKTYQDIENEYREGRATYLDLVTSLDRRNQIRLDLVEETRSYLLSVAELMKLSGNLYDAVSKI